MLLVPVPRVGEHDRWSFDDPATSSSLAVALTIGASCEDEAIVAAVIRVLGKELELGGDAAGERDAARRAL